MYAIEYQKFDTIDPSDFLLLLNSKKIRKHLIEHELFTIDTLTHWMHSKMEIDATSGCKVRGIVCEGELAGWCGIQYEEGNMSLQLSLMISFGV